MLDRDKEVWPFWRKYVTRGVGFGVSNAQTRPSVSLFMLPVDPDVELSAPLQYHISYLLAAVLPTRLITD